MRIRFWGTRGSIAKPGSRTLRHGGNASCVELRSGGGLVVLDCGTGAHDLGRALMARDRAPSGALLISHTHWDHIQGFPFFAPLFAEGAVWDVYGPRGTGASLRETLAGQMEYAYFPLTLDDLRATVRFHELVEGEFRYRDLRIVTRYLDHPAVTLGYRIEGDGAAIVYATDHEARSRTAVPDAHDLATDERDHVAFLDRADLVIHDAQFDAAEYATRVGWGHSTVDHAVAVCLAAGARRLALFHHDPDRGDAELDAMVEAARAGLRDRGLALEVSAAAEGETIEIAGGRTAGASAAAAAAAGATAAGAGSARATAADAAAPGPATAADPFPGAATAADRSTGADASADRASGAALAADRAAGADAAGAAPEAAAARLGSGARRVVIGGLGRAAAEVVSAAAGAEGLDAAILPDGAAWPDEPGTLLVAGAAAASRTGTLPGAGGGPVRSRPVLVVVEAADRTGAEGRDGPDRLVWPFSRQYAQARIRAEILRRDCRWRRAPEPPDEAARLAALGAAGILDTPREERFDRIARIASAALGTPLALITLIDSERQWFKASAGLATAPVETTREQAFCAHAILDDAPLVVPDALLDGRFADNPMVTGRAGVRFYAGCPIRSPEGYRLGTLCVVDDRPRALGAAQVGLLKDLAALVEAELLARPGDRPPDALR